jgi:general secretion pathway protein E
MGIETFLLASSLIGVIAQRLVRVLCRHCRVAKQADATECKVLQIPPEPALTIYEAKGCEECGFTGYSGRTGIYEMLPIDEHLRTMIHDHKAEHLVEKYARSKWPSIQQDGLRRVLLGETTLEEVLRVTSVDV